MRIITLRRKITVNFIILGIISIILGAGIFYNFSANNSVEAQVQKIKNDVTKIKMQTNELQSKTIEIKKYSDIYEKFSDVKKNSNGIKMDDINAILKTIADKYAIISPTIKVNLPDTLKDGIFNRSTITVLSTTANLNFSALNDVKAFAFITEFTQSIPGFVVITNIEIKKGKPYTNQDLVDISTGKSKGAISGKVDFFWYVPKSKEDAPKKDDSKKDQPKKDEPKKDATKPAEVVNAPTPVL